MIDPNSSKRYRLASTADGNEEAAKSREALDGSSE